MKQRNKILNGLVSNSQLTDEQLREQFEQALEARDPVKQLNGYARGKAEAERRYPKQDRD